MRTHARLVAVGLTAGLTTALATALATTLAGCASGSGNDMSSMSSTERLDVAVESIERTGRQIDATIARMDEVMAALATLEDPEDIDEAFGSYRSRLTALESAVAAIDERRQTMSERMTAHLEAWRAETSEVSSDTARSVAERRQASFEAALAEAQTALDALGEEFDSLLADLRDVRTVLANDLSTDGLAAADDLFQAAIERANDVRRQSGEVNRALLETRNQFSR